LPTIRILPFEARWLEPCGQLLLGLPEWFGLPSAAQAYLRDLSRHSSWIATLEQGDGPPLAGFMTLTQPAPRSFELHVIAVRRERQRQGVGRALLAHAEARARAQGGRFIWVRTIAASSLDPFYARTRAFYDAHGYHALFETDRLGNGVNPTVVLVKALC
jgi:GNAT superfamily N-acetyltransferase